AAMVVLALVSLAISALTLLQALLAGISVLILAAFALARYRKPRYDAISHDQTGWQLRDRAGEWIAATLRNYGQLGSWVILDFATPTGRWTSLLTSDATDVETRRRLLLVLAATSKQSAAAAASDA
ncbi:MAG: hypothetical protein ABIP56_06915, partial [Dokdonella sp.]